MYIYMWFLWYENNHNLKNNHSLNIFLSILKLPSIFCKIFRLHMYLWMQTKSAFSLYQMFAKSKRINNQETLNVSTQSIHEYTYI